MGYLEREMILHDTDENGNVLPIDYECKEMGNVTVRAIPPVSGRLARMITEARAAEKLGDSEKSKLVMAECVAEHIINPKTGNKMFTGIELAQGEKTIRYTAENGDIIKIYSPFNVLLDILYKISGVDVKESDKIKAVENVEEELKKKPQ